MPTPGVTSPLTKPPPMFGNKNHPTDKNVEEKLRNRIEDLEDQIKNMRQAAADEARRVRLEKEDTERKNNQEQEDKEREHSAKIAELEQSHKLALEEKEFEMKHFKEEELQKARDAQAAAELKCAIVESENKGLRELVKVSADIIDIKTLVKDVIGKLPTINLTSLPSAGASKPSKQE